MSDTGKVFIATETFSAMVDGVPVLVRRGKTRVEEGHELQRSHPQWFEEAGEHVQFRVESTEAVPGEKRGAPKRTPLRAGGD